MVPYLLGCPVAVVSAKRPVKNYLQNITTEWTHHTVHANPTLLSCTTNSNAPPPHTLPSAVPKKRLGCTVSMGCSCISPTAVTPGGNCIKIGLPGKSILGDYFQENRTSRRTFLLLRISFPGRTIFIQFIPGCRLRPTGVPSRAPPCTASAGPWSLRADSAGSSCAWSAPINVFG